MGIRRRRKTLTNLLSNMERRVTSVELRPINLLTSAQIAGALAGGDEALDEGPNSVVSLNAPNQYKAVVDGYYYGPNVSGKPRVELYFETDPGLEEDKTIRISGINYLNNSGTPVELEISGGDTGTTGSYKTLEVDTEPYDTDRDTYGGKRHTPGETIASTATFNPTIEYSYTTRRQLIVKRRISTVEATTTTAKIVFTSTNYFRAGQIVYVGMPDETPYFGIDGLFKVKEAGSNFITFDFDAPLAEPINVASVTDERYVHAVAQSKIRDGATWFDTSQDPDVAYVWDEYRWVLFGSSTIDKDDVKPSPVENLEADDENDTPPGAANGESRVTLTWDAPTTNENGKPLVDLIGYTIWSRQTPQQEWDKQDITGPETSWAKSGFQQGAAAYFAVFARDSSGNRSTPVEITHVTGTFPPQVQKPALPAVTTYLGTIKIAYNDLTAFGLVQPPSAKEIEVFFSDVANFTPGPSNFYGTFPASAGSYIIIPGTELVRGEPLSDGTDYYVRIRVRDIYGNITEASDPPVAIKVKLSDIVTYDMIDVGTLTAQAIIGLQIDSNNNPSVNGGVSINEQGIVAYAPPSNGQPAEQTFRLNAKTGAVSIGTYLGKAEAAGLFISSETATTTYATIQRADGIALVAGNAQAVASAAQSGVTAARRDLDAVTELLPGSLSVTLKQSETIRAINKGIPNSNTTEIEGGVIRSRTIIASRIGTGQFPADVVYANAINAGQITAGTISGRTLQTDGAGQRIVIDSNQSTGNRIRIYNDSGVQVGTIVGGASGSSGLRLLYETGTEVNLYEGSVSLKTSDSSVRLSGTGTRSASRFTVDSQSLSLFPLAVGGVWTIAQTYGTGTVTGRNLSGSGTRNVNVASDGLLTTLSSDVRKKKNIEDLPLSLDFINKLRPVQFEWKQPDKSKYDPAKHLTVDKDGIKNMGLIAQELKSTLEECGLPAASILGSDPAEAHEPYLEEGDTDPVLSIDYVQLVPALIKAVQELSAKIETLEKTQGYGE